MRTWGVLLLVGVAACADADDAWQGSIEVLPNGARRVTNEGAGIWRESSAWRLVPELAMGEIDGPEATTFAQLIALEAGADGRIYVLDRQLNELRVFDASGAHVRTTGRTGEGPGEYRAANGLLWLTADSLLVIDQQGARYSVVNRDGEFIRSVPRSLPFFSWLFQGGEHAGRVYELFHTGDYPDPQPVLIGTPLAGDGSALDTIPLPRPALTAIEPFRIETARGGMVMSVPFAPEAMYRLDRNGNVWHGQSGEYRIVRSSLDGDTLTDISLLAAAVPVPDSAVEQWRSGAGVKRYLDMGGKLDAGRIPKTKPFFETLFVDDQGFLWTVVNTATGDAGFDVFDPAGRYLGRLEVPGVRSDSYVVPVVRNGRLYLVGRDELDVQRVLVFRIEGAPTVSPAERT